MHQMTNLEYSFIVAELAPKIVGKHFNRIRKLGEGTYRMKIGTTEVLCELGVRIHETRYVAEAETDKFVEKAGKELDNARLISLEQVNNDRILSFTFDKGTLVFEMFGDGNAVLVRGGVTVCAAKYEKWAGREITVGKPYSPPASVPSTKLEPSDKYIIVSLMKLPLGKDYAAEALARAKIDEKTPGNKLDVGQLSRLERELESIRSSAKPLVFYDNGKPVDFALAALSKNSKLEARPFVSLSEAADEYYANVELPNPEVEKLVRRLEKQRERLDELLREEKSDRERGDFIYAHYADIERLLALAKEGKFDELQRLGAKLDKKEKSMEIELQ